MGDIYQFALEFERENREFYEKLAREAASKKLKEVFLELASEEKKHEDIVKSLKEGRSLPETKIDSEIISEARNVFEEIASDFTRDFQQNTPADQVEVYREAQELEQKSFNFYSKKAEEFEDENIREIFSRLAREEKKHEEILENIIDLVNRPETWLEDPEWYHLDEY